jgi:C1A family cysteine protease
MMRRTMIIAAGLSVGLMVLAASPAVAGYGAFALDTTAHKFGYSLNQSDQQRANELAKKNCKSDNCKVVFPVGPRQCGALAISDTKGTAWGGAVKPTRDAAQLRAIEDCQKRTSGQCKVRAAGCNR